MTPEGHTPEPRRCGGCDVLLGPNEQDPCFDCYHAADTTAPVAEEGTSGAVAGNANVEGCDYDT